MNDRSNPWVRWLAVVPCALLVTIIVQIGAEVVFRYVLIASIGYESWIPWVAKAIASVLMGSVFIGVAWIIAPHSKALVAGLALGTVTVWGATLVIRSFDESNPEWLLAMGVSGVLGGLVTLALVRRLTLR